MKKFSRRELFRGAGAAAVGGAALAVGMKTASAVLPGIGAGSRVGKSFPGLYPTWTQEVYLPSGVPLLQQKMLIERAWKAGFFKGVQK